MCSVWSAQLTGLNEKGLCTTWHCVLHGTYYSNNCLSEFYRRYQDFAFLEPVVTFLSYPFWEDAGVDSLASKPAMLFHLRFWHYKLTLSWNPQLIDNSGTYSQKKSKQTWENVLLPWRHYLAPNTILPWLIIIWTSVLIWLFCLKIDMCSNFGSRNTVKDSWVQSSLYHFSQHFKDI